MAIKTYRVAAGNDGNFGALVDGTDQTAANRVDGWTVAKIAAGNISDFDAGTKQVSGTFSAGTGKPASLILGTTANAFKTPVPLTGVFAGTSWTFTWAFRCTVASAQYGRPYMRVFRSPNADGSGATEITSATLNPGVNTAALSTTADVTAAITWNPGTITLNNEYLFFALAWWTAQQGGSNTADCVIRTGQSAAGSRIVTPDFSAVVAVPIGDVPSATTVRGISAASEIRFIPVGKAASGTAVRGLAGIGTIPIYTDLIDDFNRADGSVRAGAGAGIWAPNALFTAGQEALISGNQLAVPRNWDHLLTQDTHGADADLIVECVNPGTAGVAFTMCALETGAGTCDALAADWIPANGGTWSWNQITNGGSNNQGLATGLPGPAAGDTFWLSKRAHVFRLYRKPAGGAYTEVFPSRTYGGLVSTQGQMGIAIKDSTQRWDNFRGGPKTLVIGRVANPYFTGRDSFVSNINFGWTSTHAVAQGFKAKSSLLHEAKVVLSKLGTPTQDVIVEVQGSSGGKPNGVVAGTCGTVPFASLTTGFVEYTLPCSVPLTPGLDYFIVLRSPSPYNAINNYPLTSGLAAVLLDGYGYCTTGSGTDVWGAQGANSLTMTLKFGGQVKGVTPYIPPPITAPIGKVAKVEFGQPSVSFSGNWIGDASNNQKSAQSFCRIFPFTIESLELGITGDTGIPDNLIVEIQTQSAGQPSGVVLGTYTVAANTLSNALTFKPMAGTIPGLTLAGNNTPYWIVLRRTGAYSGAGTSVMWRTPNIAGDVYPDGIGLYFNGTSWVTMGNLDFAFKIKLAGETATWVGGITPSGSGAAPISVGKATSSLPLLDDFNRANGAIGANWSGGIVGVGGIVINGNQADSSSLGAGTVPGAAFYTAASFPTSQEASVVAVSPANTNGFQGVLVGGEGGAGGYLCGWQGTWMVLRHDGGGFVATGVSVAGTCVAGDVVGGRIVGDKVQVLKNGVVMGSVIDPTYRGSKVGVYCGAWANRIDDFRAGAPVRVVYGITLSPTGVAPVAIGRVATAPGQNYAPNPSFEFNTAGWGNYSGVTISRDTTVSQFGLASLKCVPGGANSGVQVWDGGNAGFKTPGTGTWVYSAYFKGTAGKTYQVINGGSFVATGGWERKYITTPGGVFNYFGFLAPDTDPFWVDGVQLEPGSTPTAFSPITTLTAVRGITVTLPPSIVPIGKISVAPAFPAISGLAIRLDASSLGLPNGADVASWPGLGGGPSGAISGSPNPKYATGVLNGLPVVRFTASEGRVRVTGSSAVTAQTIAYVARQRGPGFDRVVTADMAYGNALYGFWNQFQDAFYDNGWGVPDVKVAATTAWKMYSNDATAGGASRLFADGNLISTVAGGAVGLGGTLNISGHDSSAAESSDCDVAEVVVFNRVLSDAERQQVEAYLRAKWMVAPTGGSAVRGIGVTAAGTAPISVGKRASASSAKGVTLVAGGSAPISIGRKAAATTVRGATLVPLTALVTIGKISGSPGKNPAAVQDNFNGPDGALSANWLAPFYWVASVSNPGVIRNNKFASNLLGLSKHGGSYWSTPRAGYQQLRVEYTGSAVNASRDFYMAMLADPTKDYSDGYLIDIYPNNSSPPNTSLIMAYQFVSQATDPVNWGDYDIGYVRPAVILPGTILTMSWVPGAIILEGTYGGVTTELFRGPDFSPYPAAPISQSKPLYHALGVVSDNDNITLDNYGGKLLSPSVGTSAVKGITLVEQLATPVDIGRRTTGITVRGITLVPGVKAVPIGKAIFKPSTTPVASVVDDFNRADGALGADWIGGSWLTANRSAQVRGNHFGIANADSSGSARYTKQVLSGYQQIRVDYTGTVVGASRTIYLALLDDPDNVGNGFSAEVKPNSTSNRLVYSLYQHSTAGGYSYVYGDEIFGGLVSGDTIILSWIGGRVVLEVIRSGTKTVLYDVADNTYAPPSQSTPLYQVLGVQATANDVSLDNYGGKSLSGQVKGITPSGTGAALISVGKSAAVTTVRGISGLVVSGTAPLPVGRKVSATTVRGANAQTGIVAPIGKVGGVATYKSVILADNPLSYWRLGESAGTVAVDEKGLHNGIYTAAPTLGVVGLISGDANKAMQIAGVTNQGVDCTSESQYMGSTMTWESWISSAAPGNSFRSIVVNAGSYGLFLFDGKVATYDWVASAIIDTGFNVADGLRHHLAMKVQSGVPNGSRFYVDGVPVGISFTYNVGPSVGSTNIGYNSFATQEFIGVIDEVAIYNSILSPAQIAAHYAAGISGATGGGTTVRGATLAPAGVAPVGVGKRISASVVQAVKVRPLGDVPVPVGKKAAATTTRGISFSGFGVAPLPVGRKASATVVPGISVTGMPPQFVPIGRVGGVVLAAETSAYFTATGLDTVYSQVMNDLVVGLKAYGLWTKMKAIYPFIGGTAELHKWNLRNPVDSDAAYRLTFNGPFPDHSIAGGYRANPAPDYSLGWADTHLIPEGTLDPASVHMALYSLSALSSAPRCDMGNYNWGGSGGRFHLITHYTSGEFYYSLGNTTTSNVPGGDGSGLFVSSRTGVNAEAAYRNGASIGSNGVAPVALPPESIYIGAIHGYLRETSDLKFGFASIGDGLSAQNVADLNTVVQAYKVALRDNVVTGGGIGGTVIRGLVVTQTGAAPISIGKRTAITMARGITVTAAGAAPISVGKRNSATTTKGVTLAPGGAPIPIGKVGGVVLPTMPVISGMNLRLDTTALGLADGADMYLWPDASGLGNDMSSRVGIDNPANFKTNAYNGLPAVRFTAANGEFFWHNNVAIGMVGEVFVVTKYFGATFPEYNGVFGDAAALLLLGSLGTNILYPANVGSPTYYYNGVDSTATRKAPMNELAILGLSFTPINLTPIIGVDRFTSGRYWDGDICEIITFDHVLTSGERAQVNGYLNSKWLTPLVGAGTSVVRGISVAPIGTVPVPVGKRTTTTTARGVTLAPGVVPFSIGKRNLNTTVYGLTPRVQRKDVNLPATFSLAATMTTRKTYAKPLAANLSLPATQTLKRYAPRTLNASLPLTTTLSMRRFAPRSLTTGLTLLPALAKRTKVFRRLDSTLNFTATLDKKRAIDFRALLNFDLYFQAGKKRVPVTLASTLTLIAEINVKRRSFSDILLSAFLGVAKLLNAKSSGVRLLLATMGKANVTVADEDDGHLDGASTSLGKSTLESVE